MMKNLTLKKKLYGGFGILVGIFVLASIYAVIGMNAGKNGLKDILNVKVAQQLGCKDAQAHLGEAGTAFKDFMIRGDEKKKELFKQNIAGAKEQLSDALKLAANNEEKANIESILTGLETYSATFDKMVIDFARTKGDTKLVDKSYRGLTTALYADLDKFDKLVSEKMAKAQADTVASAQRTEFITVAVCIIGVLVAAVLSWFIIKSITLPIVHIGDAASRVAGGDFTRDLDVTTDDELGRLAASFNEMQGALRDTIKKIAETSAHVASASAQLSATAEQIARGASDQDSQAAQVATAMDEMSATVMEVARNSAQAADSSKEAASTANDGGGIVERTVNSMEKIAKTSEDTSRIINALGQSSDKIGEIVAVINDIADQTNLLALNAAIEAARAGEQGRGFAVVADEVRKLAERTTKATKEIASMIRTIQDDTTGAVSAMDEGGKDVTEGVALAREAGTALENIVGKVTTVTEMVQRIAAAAEEQSTASEQISGNVEAIANVVKQNASAAQESSTSAQELANLAQELQALVSRFDIGDEASGRRAKGDKPSFGGNVINGRELFGAKKAA